MKVIPSLEIRRECRMEFFFDTQFSKKFNLCLYKLIVYIYNDTYNNI